MKTFINILLFVGLVVNISGCVGNNMESFVRPNTDFSFVKRVAVMPMQNNSKDAFVAERVRDMVITQLLANGMFDVVDKGLVDSALRDQAVNLSKGPMDAGVIKRLGQLLHVQAFMLGTIDNAERVQRGAVSFPQLVITLRLVDVNNGIIFWQASGHNSGDSLTKRLFGLSSDDSFNVSFKLLRRLLATIPEGRPVLVKKVAAAEPPAKTSHSSSGKSEGGVDSVKASANGAGDTGQAAEGSGNGGGSRDIFDNNPDSSSDSNSDSSGIIVSPDSASSSGSNSDSSGIIVSPDSASSSGSNSDSSGIIVSPDSASSSGSNSDSSGIIVSPDSASSSGSNSDSSGIIVSPDSASSSDSNSDSSGIIISPDSASSADSNSNGIIIEGGADDGQGTALPSAGDDSGVKADQSEGDKKLDFDDNSLDAAHLPPK
ncbi:hypothetical protein ACOHYD_12470 [Desulfobacterota bacterium M19]